MEIHKDLVVGREAEILKELEANHDKQDRFIKYKDARSGDVYAWFDVECKEYVVFIAQETDDYQHSEGFAIYDNRGFTQCPHVVRFEKARNKILIDLTGANTCRTEDNIKDFISSFNKETICIE